MTRTERLTESESFIQREARVGRGEGEGFGAGRREGKREWEIVIHKYG